MGDLLVLCYHAVSTRWPATLAITPERMERQLGWLLRFGYRGVRFTDAILERPAGRTLSVTFDDAYRSVFENALPILERLGIPGTVFAPTAYIDSDQPMSWPGIDHWLSGVHEPELLPMNWSHLRSLADAGWEVGSHTVTHRRLTSLDGADLKTELAGSRRICEDRMQRPCRSVAYPYGAVDGRVTSAARLAGYQAAAALPRSLEGRDPLCWPRVGIYHDDVPRRFALKVARPSRRLRATTLWKVVAGDRTSASRAYQA